MEWLGIVICNFLVKNNLQIKILLLHQKDKLKNKIKQDHSKWFYRVTLHDYNRASLNEPRRTTLGEYFQPLQHFCLPPLLNEVSKIAKTKEERQQLTDYMMAKWKNSLNSVISTMPKLYSFYTSLIWWYDFNCVNHMRSLSYKA